MLIKLSCAICFINIVVFAYCESIVSVTGPKTISSSSKYNVAVSLYDAEGPCEIEIGISSTKYNVTKIINIQPMSTKTAKFILPNIEQDVYELTVKGLSGVSIEKSTDLTYVESTPLILIQTDKAIYKPGDLVKFRVLFLDEYARPAKFSQTKMISIKNRYEDRIKIWKNVNLTHGVYTGNFQLSEETALGAWTIEANVDDNIFQWKTFQVAEYELPKFEVIIEAAKNVALTDEVIKVTVRSRYTFGKPVKGKATIYITPTIAYEKVGIKKTITINGKAQVEFNIKQEVLSADITDGWIRDTYKIFAEVEEELTEVKQSNVIDIYIHKNNVILRAVEQPQYFYPDEPITITLAATRVDGSPVQDNKSPIQLHVNNFSYGGVFNENGLVKFSFTYPIAEVLNVKCDYLDVLQTFPTISPQNDAGTLQLFFNTKKHQVAKDVLIKMKWKYPIHYFTYVVTARDNIVKAATVEIPHNNSKSYTLKLSPTHEMIPKATIFVQYIYDGALHFEKATMEFEKEFQNTLQIVTKSQASPGDDIEFQISTDPDSFIGLLGVDQSVLLLEEGNDLVKDDIFAYAGKMSRVVMLTNAQSPASAYLWQRVKAGLPQSILYSPTFVMPTIVRQRKNFEESWIFEDLQPTNQTSIKFVKKIPDTLTSWVITGFSLNSKTGIALTENPTVIQVFKPFFISVYLPYSVKQGEIISIPVLIFNYMNSTLETKVSMYNSDQEYEFTEAINDVDERLLADITRSKCISISANSVGSISFMIKPKIIGFVTIEVNAVTAISGDGVQQTLKVEPAGVTQYENRAFFINLNDDQVEYSETIIIDIPENAVPNSEHIEFSAIGDLVGLTIKNIENLVRLPIGYGEHNLINFVPSILVLEYLQVIKQSSPNVTANALRIMKLGFQRELKFKRRDGSFGSTENDESGSTWLTAYIVRSFQQAAKFIYIDPDLITKALNFLGSQQTTNGNFAEFGESVNASYSSDVEFSAFVLLAFVEYKDNNNSSSYRAYIEKGVRFLLQYLDETDDIQSLSIIALVLQKVKHPLADEVLTKLMSVAKNENGYTWWSTDPKKYKRKVRSSSDIEITSYILQAMLEKGYSAEVLPIIKWLIMQRNSNGGFVSTRDTVVGLQALIEFAKKTGLSQSGTMNIDYVCEGNGIEDKGSINITPDNFMMLSTHKLPKNIRKIKFTAKGNTSSLLQLSYQYNTASKMLEPSLSLKLNIKKDVTPKKLIIDICVEYIPNDIEIEGNKTDLVVLDVTLPSGYTTYKEELNELRDFKTILFTETKKSDSIAIVYFKNLEVNNTKCISINATRSHEVAKQKPVPVVIYDYYDRERSATEYYEFKTSLCDICESDECGAVCKKNKEFSEVSSKICSSMN